jgi:hypothetical protein
METISSQLTWSSPATHDYTQPKYEQLPKNLNTQLKTCPLMWRQVERKLGFLPENFT